MSKAGASNGNAQAKGAGHPDAAAVDVGVSSHWVAEHLHEGSNISKEAALDERGNDVKRRSDTAYEHDSLTRARAEDTPFAPQTDTSRKACPSSGEGSPITGYHDRSRAAGASELRRQLRIIPRIGAGERQSGLRTQHGSLRSPTPALCGVHRS